MSFILEYLKTDEFILLSFLINILLIFLVVILTFSVFNHKKKYINFMTKLGNGNNLDLLIKKYIDEVNQIKSENSKIIEFYHKLDNNLDMVIQKIGIVKYNAFDKVAGNLSFAIALLDRKNNGIILNGIYGSQSSNIYLKQIESGESKIQLSEEEKKALKKAINKN